MTALISAVVHLLALVRGWLDDRREAAKEASAKTAESDRIAATTQTEAREAEHAAQDEMAQPADRRAAAQRLHDGAF
jgi:hypothetical protein